VTPQDRNNSERAVLIGEGQHAFVLFVFAIYVPDETITMWRRAYLFLVLIRLYFALSPSYIHPDENFQGPEVISGMN
jgi:hypothetical protein